MAVLTPLDDADARALCAAFGLPAPQGIEGIAGGSVNSNFALRLAGTEAGGTGRVFCRLYEERDLAGAEREAAMLGRLAAAGVRRRSHAIRRRRACDRRVLLRCADRTAEEDVLVALALVLAV